MSDANRPLTARLALAAALDHLQALQHQGATVADQVDQLVRQHGASVRFTNGTNVFRCCGVAGSSTSDRGARMLASWQRIADRRLGTNWPKDGASLKLGQPHGRADMRVAHG